MKKLKSLSIFFPTLNDAKILPYMIYKAYEVGQLVSDTLEIIVINDGSTDETPALLKKMQERYQGLRVITHKQNRGYGGALISGFNAARYEWVFYTDGDGQYDLSDLPLLVRKASAHIHVVNGYKLSRSDSAVRRFIGHTYNVVLKHIYQFPISDIDCDFRLIRKEYLDKINLTSQSGAICLELVMKLHTAKAQFTEVGVRHFPRRFGSSQFFNPIHLYRTAREQSSFLFHSLVLRKGLLSDR